MSATTSEKQQKWHAEHKEHAHHPKHVVVGHHGGVAVHRAVKQLQGTLLCDAWGETTADGETGRETIEHPHRAHIIGGHVIDQPQAMQGRAARSSRASSLRR